jgi:ATP-dependent exoDNAse (exonuclease V) alpha subunit
MIPIYPEDASKVLGLGPNFTYTSVEEAFSRLMNEELRKPRYGDSKVISKLHLARLELNLYLDGLDEQAVVKHILAGHKNLLLHGGAGTGKSTKIRELVTHLDNVVVVAPTGTAALNLGEEVAASTIHSLFGFKSGLLCSDTSWVKSMSSQRRQKLSLVDTLIIDEISMVNADVIDAINLSLQEAKKSTRPFGGTRLIMVGDLYQLPPVLSNKDKELSDYVRRTYGTFWFFKAKVWNASDFEILELEKDFRQTGEFLEALKRLRESDTLPEHIALLNRRVISGFESIENSIRIVGTNNEVSEVNTAKLAEIDEEPRLFTGQWEVIQPLPELELAKFKKEVPADEKLVLKVGAQVMFVKNDDQNTEEANRPRWVNGTVGIVTGFSTDGVFVRVGGEDNGQDKKILKVRVSKWEFVKHELQEEYEEEKSRFKEILRPVTVLTYEQLPLVLGWAITTHKSQGKTYDSAVISIGAMSKYPGHSYVALSRVRTLEGLHLTGRVSERDFPRNGEVHGFLQGRKATTKMETELRFCPDCS